MKAEMSLQVEMSAKTILVNSFFHCIHMIDYTPLANSFNSISINISYPCLQL